MSVRRNYMNHDKLNGLRQRVFNKEFRDIYIKFSEKESDLVIVPLSVSWNEIIVTRERNSLHKNLMNYSIYDEKK